MQSIGQVGRVRKKPWEVADSPETAVEMIGLEIKIHGIEWLEKRKDETAFLESMGVSPEEAMERHSQWQRNHFLSLGLDEKGQPLDSDHPTIPYNPQNVRRIGLGGRSIGGKG